MPRTAKELKPKRELQGISQRQIDDHHDVLYKGYVNKLNEIESKAPEANLGEANPNFSQIRELKKEEVFCTNAVRLHEDYFENMSGGGGPPKGQIAQLINEDFGSLEKWSSEFRALGICGRGWVVLAYDWIDGKLHNYMSDIHSEAVWGCSPLLIMDVYEHAYFLDYGAGRRGYIDAFMNNVNWDIVNQRLERLNVQQHRQTRAA